MGNSGLKQLLEDAAIGGLISRTATALGTPLAIRDDEDDFLFGDSSFVGKEFAVTHGGKAIGTVQGKDGADVIADLLGTLMSQSAKIEELRSESNTKYGELSLLSKLAEKASSSMDMDEVGRVVVSEAGHIFSANRVFLTYRDHQGIGFRVLSANNDQRSAEDNSDVLDRLFDSTLSEAKAEIVHLDRQQDCDLEQCDIRSVMRAPLVSRNNVLGAIYIGDSDHRDFTENDLELLKTLAAQIGAPLESVRLNAKLNAIMKTIHDIDQFNAVEVILDKVLMETRRLANADAGSIFLVENDRLAFSYVQNDTLFKDDLTNRALYSTATLSIDEDSIVGHVAVTRRPLAIDNAYALPEDVPYSFNDAFDRETGYRTVSSFTVPLLTQEEELIGVMQIINARDHNGIPRPFSLEDQSYIPLFARNASEALQRAFLNRERVLRMMKTAQLRDPRETGPHVERVGAFSAEIYYRWAQKQGITPLEAKRGKDLIRIAAMLHDVGKVGISDTILKKPAKLTDEEFDTMKWHTVMGAQLFIESDSDLDRMCAEIALHHHEKWAGRGYPGRIPDIAGKVASLGEPLNGEDIPLTARIVALADVYDALCSKRCYKEPWPEERVLDTIRGDAGTHFDPRLVHIFFEIHDVIMAIREKFKDEPEEEEEG